MQINELLLPLAIAATLGTHAAPALAQDSDPFGTASVTLGPYIRAELGAARPEPDGAFWLPPGASDPKIFFDADALDDTVGFGAVALGYDWQTGWRAELAFFGMGDTGIVAPCERASDGSPCSTHADITEASVSTLGAMANVYYVPFEARGSNSRFQPFVVAGLGLARNEVGDWTRTKNPDNPTFANGTVRSFEGDSSTGVAWSVGVGASMQVTRPGQWPVMLEASWRYYDFGSASGSSTPIGSGSEPRQGFTFDNTDHVVTFGVRVPLRRY